MCRQFEAKTTALCGTHIMTMLQQHAADPTNQWKAKDGALQLLVAVCVKASTAATGVSSTNDAINVLDLVNQHVVPELQNVADVNALPVIRADCIKFLCTFRNQLPKETIRLALPLVGAHLRSSSVVVQSYAAYFLERVLTVKDRTPGQRPTPRFGRADLQPMLDPLFQSLFVILQAQDESFENEYVMKAVMRCLSVAKEDIVPLTPTLLQAFNACLERVCKNPRNPQFNHFLFESTAVLVGSACKMDPNLTGSFETMLFPPFQTVLAMDVAEFSPYVFQILAQLLEVTVYC
jgi:exportin-2 (importin alpha re-exporter)